MKFIKAVPAYVGIVGFALSANAFAAKYTKETQKINYAIGVDIGRNFQQQGIEMDRDPLVKGMQEGYSGKITTMSEEEIGKTLEALQKQLAEKRTEEFKMLAAKNEEKGKAFLEANKKKDGIVTTDSGLQYRVIQEGKGKMPAESDTVTTHYRGTLIDGTEFDSSYKRGEPASFPVNGVIPGWVEALQLMKTGAKWELFVPSNLAYGAQGAGGAIGPNETLIFEVELISIEGN